jgi:hypothetical protein
LDLRLHSRVAREFGLAFEAGTTSLVGFEARSHVLYNDLTA